MKRWYKKTAKSTHLDVYDELGEDARGYWCCLYVTASGNSEWTRIDPKLLRADYERRVETVEL
jgi:hypothetical protein